MRLSIYPTGEFQMIEGQPCRLWEGWDEAGTPVHVHVRCVSPQTHDPEALEAFDAKLAMLPPLRPTEIMLNHRFLEGSDQ